jgi:hypothetical protein
MSIMLKDSDIDILLLWYAMKTATLKEEGFGTVTEAEDVLATKFRELQGQARPGVNKHFYVVKEG